MDIRHYTADDTDVVDRVVDLVNAGVAVDSPWAHPQTRTEVEALLRHGWDGEPPEAFAAYEDDRLIGKADLWTSEWDNTHLAWARVEVHPEDRCRGVGSGLLEYLRDQARAAGRTTIGSDGWDLEPVHRFARRNGLVAKSVAVSRRQDLTLLDRDEVGHLRDESQKAASDYELVRTAGRTPTDMLEQVAQMAAAINDAPTDDLDIEDEVFTADRIAAYETAALARNQRLYRMTARRRDTGELAGHTVVAVEAERPEIGHQHDTSVVRAHRGHRLGLLLKSAMLGWLAEAEPQLRTVDTWNAESNDHMIEVNEVLGYRVLGRAFEFQRGI